MKISGSPLAYWISSLFFAIFDKAKPLSSIASPRKGMVTADNPRFIRQWSEVDYSSISLSSKNRADSVASKCKWFPYQKGGGYRLWYGNHDWVVNWEGDGRELLNMQSEGYPVGSTNHNLDYIFKPSLVFSKIASSYSHFRFSPQGFLFDDASGVCFVRDESKIYDILGYLCSKTCSQLTSILNPTVNLQPGNVASLPYIPAEGEATNIVRQAISISKDDWDSLEGSWEFMRNPLAGSAQDSKSLEASWEAWSELTRQRRKTLYELQQQNNKIYARIYGVDKEISSDVADDQISLLQADRELDIQRLISYAIGCMMGRYSLDEPGLIYARSGGFNFDPSRYTKFPTDADGIIPVTDESWFEDDAAERVWEFVKVVWGGDTLVENMEWLADSLGRKAGESAAEAIRRYLTTSFYKDHLQTYKKRPIYWLFSSGKQKAFECLVYLHRYNEGTLSRMRMEYVVPLQSRMQARIDKLTDDIDSATSSAQQKALQKRKDKLTKQLEELRRFDENLRPYADQRITLDLDDGVKVNYGKFGNLLAEVKAITGGKED